MIRIEFTEYEVAELEYERFNNPNQSVQRKMEAVYLKSHGLPHKVISKICNISSVTLTEYLRQYIDGGINRLKTTFYKGRQSELNEHSESLEQYFIENPPRSTKEAAKVIEDRTGIKRGITQVRNFLTKNGFRYRKTAAIPSKAIDEDFIQEQNRFKEEELEPLLEEAVSGKREVFLWMPPTLFTGHS